MYLGLALKVGWLGKNTGARYNVKHCFEWLVVEIWLIKFWPAAWLRGWAGFIVYNYEVLLMVTHECIVAIILSPNSVRFGCGMNYLYYAGPPISLDKGAGIRAPDYNWERGKWAPRIYGGYPRELPSCWWFTKTAPGIGGYRQELLSFRWSRDQRSNNLFALDYRWLLYLLRRLWLHLGSEFRSYIMFNCFWL